MNNYNLCYQEADLQIVQTTAHATHGLMAPTTYDGQLLKAQTLRLSNRLLYLTL